MNDLVIPKVLRVIVIDRGQCSGGVLKGMTLHFENTVESETNQ